MLDGSGDCWNIAGLDLGAGPRQLDSARGAQAGHDGHAETRGERHLGRIAFAPSWREDQIDTRQALALRRGRRPQPRVDQPSGGLRPLARTNQEGGARDHPRCLERLEDSVASGGRAGQQDVGSRAAVKDVPVGPRAGGPLGSRQDDEPLRAMGARAPLLFGKPAAHHEQIGEHALGFLARDHRRWGAVPAEQVAVRPAACRTVEIVVQAAQARQILHQQAGQFPRRGCCEGATSREARGNDEGDVYAKVLQPPGSHLVGDPPLHVAGGHQAIGAPTRPQAERRLDARPRGL